MAIREVLQIGDPRLKRANAPVTDFNDPRLAQVIQDLVDTMRAGGSVGFAAPQIGENWQLLATEFLETASRPRERSDALRIYINPILRGASEEVVEIWEACRSVANATLYAPVVRPKVVTVEAADVEGKRFRLTADGILGRVVQHEFDHLVGVEFLEKVTDLKRFMSRESYQTLIKSRPDVQTASATTVKSVEPA